MNKTVALLNELNKLEVKFFETNEWSEEDLMDWYIESVAIFEAIGLREKFIEDFSILFNTFLLQTGGENSIFNVNEYPPIYRTKTASLHLATIKKTFKFAIKKIEILEEDEKLIPNWLLKHFESSQLYGHIFTGLTSINDSVQNKSISSILSSANTLLDSTLDYIEELRGMNLGKKLNKLANDPILIKKIGLDLEIINALNNSRVIRNLEVVHPRKNVRQSVPYIVAISYAYLTVLLLKIMMNLEYFN